MPQDQYVRRNADKLNKEGADMRPYGVGPTMRELRFKDIAGTIGAPRSPVFPPTPRKKAMSNAAEAAKNNAKEYGTDIQRLQREMSSGTRNARDLEQNIRMNKRKDPSRIQAEMDMAKKDAETRSYYSNQKSPRTIQKGMAESTRKVQSAPNGTFKGGAARSKMSASMKIK